MQQPNSLDVLVFRSLQLRVSLVSIFPLLVSPLSKATHASFQAILDRPRAEKAIRKFSQLDRLCHLYVSSSLENTRIAGMLVLCQSLFEDGVVRGIILFCCATVISEVFASTMEPGSNSVMQCIIGIVFTLSPRFQYAFGFGFHL